jgi:ACS family D-galactonate transporter-like MFS transporter
MPVMQKDLQFSPALVGLVFSSFFWGYTVMQIPIGWLCDRIRPGKLLVSSGFLWGVIQILTGLISGAQTLVFLRVLLGVSESPMYPAGSKLQSVWLPSTERGRGAALLAAGSDVGIAVGGILVPLFLASLGGWRPALSAAGVLTIIVVLACYRVMNSDPDTSRSTNQAERDYIRTALAEEYEVSQASRISAGKIVVSRTQYLTSRSFWSMCLGFYCVDALYYGVMTWGPLYLSSTQHLDITHVGGAIFIIYCVAIAGALVGGYCTDKLRHGGAEINAVMRKSLTVLGIIIAACMYFLSSASSALIAIGLLCVAMFCLKWSLCIYWSTPAAIAQRKDVGITAGAMNFIGNFSGVLTPIFIGLIVGATGSYFWALMMFLGYGLGGCLFPWFLDYSKKIGS